MKKLLTLLCIVYLITIIILLCFCSCRKSVEKPVKQIAEVKFRLTKFIDPINIPFTRAKSIYGLELWSHVFNADTFDLAMNPGKHYNWGIYNDLDNTFMKVPYGTYSVFIAPRHDEPAKSDGLIYYAHAMNVVINQSNVTIDLEPATNQGLMLLNPDNIWWTSEQLYSSQGLWYFYSIDSFGFDFKTIDDSTQYTFEEAHVIPGTVYYGEAPVKGLTSFKVNFDSLFKVEEISIFY